MSLIDTALKRPVSVLMFFSALVLLGGISLYLLPLDLMPEVSYPVLTVTTRLGGYSPPEIEQTLTKPMESALASLNNLVRLRSFSREGESEFRLAFEVGTDMDFVMQEVRERLHQLRPQFPADTRTPRLTKYDPASAPVMVVSLFGSHDPISLRLTGEDILKKTLARVPRVANIEVHGGRRPEILIEPDLDRLRALGLSILELTEMLKQSNVELAVGHLDRGRTRLPLRSLGSFRDLQDIAQLAVKRTPTGSLVLLNQVANISYAAQDEEIISRYQGEPRVMVTVYREYGAHLVDLSGRLREALAGLQRTLPYGLMTEVIYDQGEFIVGAVGRLRDAALLGAFFAVLVVWVFLRHGASTLLIVASIPISVIATFGFMYLTNISLNLVSLAGLTLGVGMLVDNAIVVVENIYRRRRAGFPGSEAAAVGTKEVLQAITGATLVHLAVFFPIFFFQKKVRLFYQDLCYTVSVSLILSLLVAVILVPVAAARFPAPKREAAFLPRLARLHRRLLIKVLRRRWLWLGGSALLLLPSLLLLGHLGFESATRLDRGEFTMILQTPPGTVAAITDRLAQQAEHIILEHREVKDVSTEIRENLARLRVRLKPVTDRTLSTSELVERLRPAVSKLPAHVHFQLERRGDSDNAVTLEVSGPRQETLIGLALEVRRRLRALPQLRDVVIHLKDPSPELEVLVDHERAGYLGLTALEVAQAVRSALTGPLASRFREPEREVEMRTRLAAGDRETSQVLQQLTVPKWVDGRPPHQVQVPLWPAVQLRRVMGSTEIHRFNQRRGLEMSAETRDLDLYRAAALILTELEKIPCPPGYEVRLGQSFAELEASRREIFFALVLALTLIYMIMAALFESFRTPFIVMCAVPLAGVGIAAALWLTGYAVSVAVYVGALALAGIVVNNAIVLVDHTNALRERGLSYWRAVLQGAQDRLRPILITSATAILGLLPLALERQEGASLWSPLAWTIIGGLITSTFLTLFLIPAIYSVINFHRGLPPPLVQDVKGKGE